MIRNIQDNLTDLFRCRDHTIVWTSCQLSVVSFTSRQCSVKKFLHRSSVLLLSALMSAPITYAEDDLGRFFTTPRERNVLDKLRHQKPAEITITPMEIVPKKEPVVEEDKPVIGGITVKGLVYRENGKSTAWINSGNTYEGNLGNQYIQVDSKDIDPDNIEIEIPLNDTRVKLKTGETYDPEAGQVNDIKYR